MVAINVDDPLIIKPMEVDDCANTSIAVSIASETKKFHTGANKNVVFASGRIDEVTSAFEPTRIT